MSIIICFVCGNAYFLISLIMWWILTIYAFLGSPWINHKNVGMFGIQSPVV